MGLKMPRAQHPLLAETQRVIPPYSPLDLLVHIIQSLAHGFLELTAFVHDCELLEIQRMEGEGYDEDRESNAETIQSLTAETSI